MREYHEKVAFSRMWALDKSGESELTPEIVKRLEEAGYSLNEIGITHMDAVLEKYKSI